MCEFSVDKVLLRVRESDPREREEGPDEALAARRSVRLCVPVLKYVNCNRRVTSLDYLFDHVQ